MSGYQDEDQAIRKRLLDAWTALAIAGFPATAIAWPGVEFTPSPDAPYMAMHIMNGKASQIACGPGAQVRCPGVIQLIVCVPDGKGEQELRSYIDKLCVIFDNAQFSSGSSGTIRTRRSDPGPAKVVQGWICRAVGWEFWRDVAG